MLENSFYWNFNDHDSVQKSTFISFIQKKNHGVQLQQCIKQP